MHVGRWLPLASGAVWLLLASYAGWGQTDRPNILWLTYEDAGPDLGCYGDPYADTPNMDHFAERSLRYLNAWSTAPVCAPARTTILAGMYATSLGAQHMRSEVPLPAGVYGYPRYLRDAGYYCTNNRKTDYNLINVGEIWDESSGRAHWKNRGPSQPFFAVFNFNQSHESQIRNKPGPPKHDPALAPVPPYHPDLPEVRNDWAHYYDNLTTVDGLIAQRLAELDEAGLTDDTIVFIYSDHGSGMPRHKRWTYQSGLRVPLLIHVPDRFRYLAPADYAPGGATDRLVGFVDLAPTVLSIAGVLPPEHMQGHAFLGAYEAPPQFYAYGFRDRMDERIDMTRCVRDARYLYVRNYMPHRRWGQYLNYMFQTPTTAVWKAAFDRGELNEVQARFWEEKPSEELYDLTRDPYQIVNLIDEPDYAAIRARLRKAHQDHLRCIRDLGFLPESEIHSRSVGTSPYEMAHDDARYPLLRILHAADVATLRKKTSELAALLEDDDSAVRYWAAMGHLIREDAAPLRAALRDDSPSVRVVAAETLGRFGNAADQRTALDALLELASLDRNDLYTAVMAMNAIDYLDETARPAIEKISALPLTREGIPGRLNSYIARLVEKTLADLGATK